MFGWSVNYTRAAGGIPRVAQDLGAASTNFAEKGSRRLAKSPNPTKLEAPHANLDRQRRVSQDVPRAGVQGRGAAEDTGDGGRQQLHERRDHPGRRRAPPVLIGAPRGHRRSAIRQRQHPVERREVGRLGIALRALQPEMIEHQAQAGMAAGDGVEQVQVLVVEDHPADPLIVRPPAEPRNRVNRPDVEEDEEGWLSVAAVRRECRGIIFDTATGDIIRRPFHKFFNVNERDETQDHRVDLSRPHAILEKLDGSMIAPFLVNGELIWGTKMGATDVAKPVEEFIKNNPQYLSFAEEAVHHGLTPIFEWCSRKQRIVLDYKEDQLVLTAMRNQITG